MTFRIYFLTILFSIILLSSKKSYSQNTPEKIKFKSGLLVQADSLYYLGDIKSTIDKLKEALDSYRRIGFYFSKKTAKSNLLHFAGRYPMNFDICIMISKLFNELGQYYESFKYLELARTECFASTGCGNGIIMYRTKLSLYYADCHLKNGDKNAALRCLIPYFLSNESYQLTVAEKLRHILLTRYSQEEINYEVDKGLSTMYVGEKPNSKEKEIKMTFFGVQVSKYFGGELEESIERYKNHPSVKILKNESK